MYNFIAFGKILKSKHIEQEQQTHKPHWQRTSSCSPSLILLCKRICPISLQVSNFWNSWNSHMGGALCWLMLISQTHFQHFHLPLTLKAVCLCKLVSSIDGWTMRACESLILQLIKWITLILLVTWNKQVNGQTHKLPNAEYTIKQTKIMGKTLKPKFSFSRKWQTSVTVLKQLYYPCEQISENQSSWMSWSKRLFMFFHSA